MADSTFPVPRMENDRIVQGALPAHLTPEALDQAYKPSSTGGSSSGTGTRAFAKGRLSTEVPVPSGSAVVIPFGAEEFDTTTMHSTSANTTRFTAPVTGVYRFSVTIGLSANATGNRHCYFLRNGAGDIHDDIRGAVQPVAGTGYATRWSTGNVFNLSAGDYMEVGVFQNSGATLTLEPLFTSAALILEG